MVSEAKHIAIILDGNRRFARKLGIQPWKGHELGMQKLEELFKWCMELGIKELTLYAFSTENFNRPKRETDFLFSLFKKKFDEIKNDNGIFKNKVKVNLIGRIEMFPNDIKKTMLEAAEKTKNNEDLVVNFALGYGGKQEIVHAMVKVAEDVQKNKIIPKNIDEKTITNYLYLKSEPDMVIRPGGEMRLSNFLLWQSSYSELFFLKKTWPEFTKEDLVKCIDEFKRRGRRFGK